MKKWTEELLTEAGYKIQNAEITNVSLNMRDHGVLTLDLSLEGGGWELYTAVMYSEKDM